MVNTPDGYIPVAPTVNDYTVQLDVTSISPNQLLNPDGGQTLVITGDHFPTCASYPCSGQSATVLIGTSTTCTVVSSTLTTITCLLGQYNEGSVVSNASLPVTVTVNG